MEARTRELSESNARLTESLAHQTATAEVLRAITSSPADLQPVLDIIIESAVRLCRGEFGALFRFDGEMLELLAHDNVRPQALEALRKAFPAAPDRSTGLGRAILDRAVVHIPDVTTETGYRSPLESRTAGYRCVLSVPMLREGISTGVISITRRDPEPFSDTQIELVKTLADQGAIAIENARLFAELQARTRALTRSVDELKALGEIGQTVSATLELGTVLDTIVAHAVQLTETDGGTIWEYDETTQEFLLRATHGMTEEHVRTLRDTPLTFGEGVVGRAAVAREPVQIPDVLERGAYEGRMHDVLVRSGFRALLAVPLIREERIIGGLVVRRRTPGTFSP